MINQKNSRTFPATTINVQIMKVNLNLFISHLANHIRNNDHAHEQEI